MRPLIINPPILVPVAIIALIFNFVFTLMVAQAAILNKRAVMRRRSAAGF